MSDLDKAGEFLEFDRKLAPNSPMDLMEKVLRAKPSLTIEIYEDLSGYNCRPPYVNFPIMGVVTKAEVHMFARHQPVPSMMANIPPALIALHEVGHAMGCYLKQKFHSHYFLGASWKDPFSPSLYGTEIEAWDNAETMLRAMYKTREQMLKTYASAKKDWDNEKLWEPGLR